MGSRNQPAKTESSFEKMTSVQSMLLAVGFKMTESVQYRGYISGYIEEYYGAKVCDSNVYGMNLVVALDLASEERVGLKSMISGSRCSEISSSFVVHLLVV